MVFSFFDVQNPVKDRLRIRRFHGQVVFYSDARQKQAHKTHPNAPSACLVGCR